MPAAAISSTNASSPRWTRLYWFCTHTTGCDRPRLCDLRRSDIAKPQVPDQPALLQFGKSAELPGDRSFSGLPWSAVPVIITRKFTTSSVSRPRLAEIILDTAREIAGLECRFHEPSSPRTAPTLVTIIRSSRIGVSASPNDLVGDVGPSEIARVDVVDAARDGFAQHRKRGIPVLRRTEHAGPGKLHRASSPCGPRCGLASGKVLVVMAGLLEG